MDIGCHLLFTNTAHEQLDHCNKWTMHILLRYWTKSTKRAMISTQPVRDCMTSGIAGLTHPLFHSKRWIVFCRDTPTLPNKGLIHIIILDTLLCKWHVSPKMVAEVVSASGWHSSTGDKLLTPALLCVADCTRASIKILICNAKSSS